MRDLFIFLFSLFFLLSCNSKRAEIDGDLVNVNDSTYVYTYKSDSSKVTGIVIFYEMDTLTGKKYKSALREVKDGNRINKGFQFYPDGNVQWEYYYENGLQNGTAKMYYENGKLEAELNYKSNKVNGVENDYNENGIQSQEFIFEDGQIIRQYDFDNNGKKIIPAVDKLSLLQYETGFYEYRDLNSLQLLYQPMVIMKLKNISDQPLTEEIQIDGVFISKGEEWSKSTKYFQGFSDLPLDPGLSRQTNLSSSVGFTSYYGISKADIYCNILVNRQQYERLKIEDKLLSSNRIQSPN